MRPCIRTYSIHHRHKTGSRGDGRRGSVVQESSSTTTVATMWTTSGQIRCSSAGTVVVVKIGARIGMMEMRGKLGITRTSLDGTNRNGL